MFKKSEEVKSIYELDKAELAKIDIEFSRTVYGRKLNNLTILPAIMTVFSSVYVFMDGIAKGYVDITNIGILLMIGLGLVAVVRIMYYQNLSQYYNRLKDKKN